MSYSVGGKPLRVLEARCRALQRPVGREEWLEAMGNWKQEALDHEIEDLLEIGDVVR